MRWACRARPPCGARARGRGRRPTRYRRTPEHQPMTATTVAQELAADAWQTVSWREGASGALSSRFAAVRVRPAHGDAQAPRAEEWLLIEWPEGEAAPTHYTVSTLPASASLQALVATTKGRWPVEHQYRDLKQEVGLGQYEGRSWRGFHHPATLCIAAYGFLLAERCAFPPGSARPRGERSPLALSHAGRRRRAAAEARAPCADLHRDPQAAHRGRSRSRPAALPRLPAPSTHVRSA